MRPDLVVVALVVVGFGVASMAFVLILTLRHPAETFQAVTASNFHSCGLRTDDTITCWGEFL